jgi:hypothetical protein
MFGTMGQTNVKNLGNGGTMDGDVTITGDLTVSGGISLSLNEVLQGTSTIDINSTEALLVRKDSDGGDVFIVDTTNQQVGVNLSNPAVSLHVVDTNNPADGTLRVGSGVAYSEFKSNASGTGKLIINNYSVSGSAHGILFQSNGSTNMTLTAGGLLGVGVNPSDILDLKASDPHLRFIDSSDSDKTWRVGVANNEFRIQEDGVATPVKIAESSVDNSLVIDGSGNTTLAGDLTITGGDIFSANLGLQTTNGTGTIFLSGNTTINDAGHDVDFRVESDTNTHALFVQGSDGNIGIGVTNPVAKMDILGTRTLNLTDNITDNNNKNAVITSSQWDSGTETEGFLMIQSFSNASTNRVDIGGGNSGHNSAEEIRFFTGGDTNVRTGTQAMHIDNSQNIGIGTASPDYKLDVAGNIGMNEHLYHNGDADTYLQMLDDRILLFAGGDEVIDYEESASSLLQIANGGEADINFGGGNMFIGGSQGSYDARVGIGSDSPNQFVEIKRASRTTTFDAGNSDTWADVLVRNPQTQPDSATGIAFQLDSNYHTNGSTGIAAVHGTGAYEADMVFITRPNSLPSSEKMRLTSGGFLNLGNSPTVSKNSHVGSTANGMTISGAVAPTLSLWDSDDANNTGHFFQIGTDTNLWSYNGVLKFLTGTSGTERMRIDSSGNVLIGSSGSALGTLDVRKTSAGDYLYISGSSDGGRGLTFTSSDVVSGGVTFFGASHNINCGSGVGSLSISVNGSSNVKFKLDTNSRISLSNNDNGFENTIFGKDAGKSIVSGADKNAFFGAFVADSTLTSGADFNAGFGYGALSGLTSGAYNTALGSGSMLNSTTGSYNVAVGNTAMGTGVTTGSNNVAVGKSAGESLTSGSNNTIVGRLTADALTSGSSNVVIGDSALGTATTATLNVAIGGDCMSLVPASVAIQDVVAIGQNAFKGSSSTTDGANGTIAIGRDSLKGLTSGEKNTAIGYKTLSVNNDVGSSNTAVGYEALKNFNPSSAGHGLNTAVGTSAGEDVSTGTGNTLIGDKAGNTGSNDITTGTLNTVVGQLSGISASDGTNQTVIGRGVTGQADNSVTLGNADVTAVYMAQDSGATVHCAGVNFPDSQVASSDANTLDDYEEGEYTPALSCSSSGTFGLDAGSNTFVYTKIGRQVHVQGEIQVTSESGSPSGDLRLTLPFTTAVTQTTDSSDIALGHLQLNASGTSLAGQLYCRTQGGLNYMTFRMRNDDCTETVLDHSSVDTNFYITINLTYNA